MSASGSNSTISGFTLTQQLTASVCTNVFAEQLVPAYYHYSVKLDVGQYDLFQTCSFYDDGDDVVVDLKTNAINVTDASGNVTVNYRTDSLPIGTWLKTAICATHNTDVETSAEAFFIPEWSGITGTNATLMAQTSNNTSLLAGYHNQIQDEFSATLISQEQSLGDCLLDIVAKSLFNHPGSKAAIANDSYFQSLTITDVLHNTSLYESIDTQFREIFLNDAQSIFDQYVSEYSDRYATAVGTSDADFNDVGSSGSKEFNFVDLTFYMYFVFNSYTLAVTDNNTNTYNSAESPYKPFSFASLPDPNTHVVDDFTRIIRLDLYVSQKEALYGA